MPLLLYAILILKTPVALWIFICYAVIKTANAIVSLYIFPAAAVTPRRGFAEVRSCIDRVFMGTVSRIFVISNEQFGAA